MDTDDHRRCSGLIPDPTMKLDLTARLRAAGPISAEELCPIAADEIERLRAEAPAWQPIETAPRDRRVLVFGNGCGIVAWTGDDCWPDDATHWRPLPAPPVTP
jgi:hypothetical protein